MQPISLVDPLKVTAGGVTLTENTDYTVDYMMGVVNILNQNLIESGTPLVLHWRISHCLVHSVKH